MEKELSLKEYAISRGCKRNPNMPNVAIFIPNKPKKKSKKKEKK
jgi:hypothetical protein